MERSGALGERSENILNIIDIFNHKKIYIKRDPILNYYLLTYVCNYTNDSIKSYNTLYDAINKIYKEKASQIAIGWEVNKRGYMHVHAILAFKKIPIFNQYKSTGCQLNYKPIENNQENIDRVLNYIYKNFEDYGWSKDATIMEQSLYRYVIQKE